MIKEKEINPYAFYIFMAVTQPTMRAWVMKTYRKNQSACDGMSGKSVDEQARAFFRSRTPGLYCEMIKAVKVAEFVGLADFCKRLMQSYPEHNQVKREFPKGTVLVGGHPRWQKFFAQGHSREMIL